MIADVDHSGGPVSQPVPAAPHVVGRVEHLLRHAAESGTEGGRSFKLICRLVVDSPYFIIRRNYATVGCTGYDSRTIRPCK